MRHVRRAASPATAALLALLALPLLIGSAMASPRGVLGELFSADG